MMVVSRVPLEPAVKLRLIKDTATSVVSVWVNENRAVAPVIVETATTGTLFDVVWIP